MDGLFFEIITEAEIAQHFKKGMMPCRIADIFQVVMLAACTHTALAGRRPYIFALFTSKEHVLKLHHAGIGEQQGRIVARNQRTRRLN